MKTARIQGQSSKNICKVLFVLIMVFVNGSAGAEIIPAARKATWQGNVGVEKGIPSRTITRNCVISDGAVGDGVADDTTSIRKCISNTPVGSVAYLPAGTYSVMGTITLNKGITLRGTGRDKTVIRNDSDIPFVVFIGVDGGIDTAVNITSGYTKGSTEIVMENASTFSVGDYIGIDELNDTTIPVTPIGSEGTCSWCGMRVGLNGTRARGQTLKISGKVGNTIYITPPLFLTFSSGNIPKAYKIKNVTENAGVENLTVTNGIGSNSNGRSNIVLMNTANSWVKNVKTELCGKRCINLWGNNYRDEIRDSYMTDCLDHINSDACYGTLLGFNTSSCLIENNIYNTVSDGPILAWGASGNVIGYNYLYNVHRSAGNETTWFLPDMWTHGAHTSFNLWEGNEFVGVGFDDIWGSHSSNTLFRNRVLGKSNAIVYGDYIQAVSAIIIEKNNHYINLVGNVLGTSGWNTIYGREGEDYSVYDKLVYKLGYTNASDVGASGNDNRVKATLYRHGNWDSASNSVVWDAGNPDHAIPSSLYRLSKPDWWCNETPWPPIGSDRVPMASDVPAKRRYERTTCTVLMKPLSPSNVWIK